ncbi:MAG TPA: hypothetical protein PK018_13355 [Candidatus Competibacter sp.]|nr:hypothetical protein [Candidatus Competibacter sp.]
MSQEPEHRMPPLSELFVYGLIIVGALYVTANYGLDGLLGAALLVGLVLLARRGSEEDDEQPRKPMPNAFNEQKFGPTTEELYGDFGYKDFPQNWLYRRYHGKD